MQKKEKERWKDLLAVERGVLYELHLEETKKSAQKEMTKLVNRGNLSLRGLIAKQLKFLAWKIWLLQGMVLAALCAAFYSLYGGMELWWNERFFARFLCGSGGVIAACALPILQRSLRYGMYELECSTRFSIKGGLAAQLLFVGIGDAGMLGALAYLMMRCGAGGRIIFLFGVIPFLTAAVTGLMLWKRIKGGTSVCLPLLACMGAVFAAYKMIAAVASLFKEGILWFGVFYAFLCVCMLGKMCRKLFLREREGELLWKLY